MELYIASVNELGDTSWAALHKSVVEVGQTFLEKFAGGKQKSETPGAQH